MITFFKILFFIIIVLHSACKTPFSTREPEKPRQEQSSWIQPTSAYITLTNLRNAVAEKNVTNYMKSLADTSYAPQQFRFYADPAVANANPTLFEKWDFEKEQQYSNHLKTFLPKDSTSYFSMTLISEIPAEQDSAVLIQDYHLEVHFRCDQPECPTIREGQAEFRLVKSNEDLWYIHRIIDRSTGDLPTWSALRAYFGKL